MNLLNKLTLKNLKLNKKRTIVTIIGIVLSVALITAVASMFFSARDSLILFETREKGNFHTAFFDVPLTDLKYFKENRNIESYSIVKNIGYANLLESQNANKPYIYVTSFNQSALENLGVNLIEGRLPKNQSEILIPSHLKTNGRVEYKVGDKLSLDIGKRVSDNEELNQNNPFIEEMEEIIETKNYEFTVVGIIERPITSVENYAAPGFTFITYLKDENNLEGTIDLYARYTKKSLKEHYYVTADILDVDREIYKKIYGPDDMISTIDDKQWETITSELEKAKYQISSNEYLISLETNIFGDTSTKYLGVVVLVVCLIIIFTSVFCIKNSFDISITEKIRQYGMLSSIGATKKQIKKNVYYEAFILGLFGIPIGVLSGLFASYLLIVISNLFLADMLSNISLIFSFSWLAILFSASLGAITIYLSARKSAHKASKISPISAIRSQNDIKIKSKKLKSPVYIKKIFGIGGEVSYKNLKRNRKKYRTTVISIIVCVSVFIALSYFMNIAFKTIKKEFGEYDYNISLSYSLSGSEEIKKKTLEITSFDYIKQYSIIKNGTITIKNPMFSKEYLENFKEAIEEEEDCISIYAVGKKEYERYIKKLGLNYEEVKNQGILINITTVYDEKENTTKIISKYDYQNKDKIQGDFDLVIGEITTQVPFGMRNVFESNSKVIVSDELFEQIITDGVDHEIMYIDATNPDKLQDEIDNHLKDYEYNLTNKQEQVKMMKSFYNLIGIFLYGFIIVIALIGITNIFNTITTNMELRKQEFAMLKSIGMTKKEFRRMIRLESFFYGMKSLIIGIPIGCILSYLLHYLLLGKDITLPYELPYFAILISIVAVFFLITCIMKYSISKINKQNIIETIRNENI